MLREYQRGMLGLFGLVVAMSIMALSSVGASTAFAEPELLWCMEPANIVTPTYATAAECEKLENAAENLKWAWEDETLTGEEFELMFTSGPGLMLAAAGLIHIECTDDEGGFKSAVLEANGRQMFGSGDVTFLGCILLSNGEPCNSPGQASGVILTVPLLATLVYLKKPKAIPVGILLEPETGKTFVEIECVGGTKGNVEGALIGEISEPYNTEITTSTASFKIVGGKQQWAKIEEEAAKFELLAFGESTAQLESVETLELLINGVTLTAIIDA